MFKVRIGKVTIAVLIILAVLIGVGYLYGIGAIKTSSPLWGSILYILSIPTALLIKWFKRERGNITPHLNIEEHKKVREEEIFTLEERINRRKREIAAIEATQRENDSKEKHLTDLALWGKDILEHPVSGTE